MAKLYFRYGAMNSGKSTALIQVAHNYEERDMKVLVVKPGIDTKGGNSLNSRLGIKRKVDFSFSETDDIFSIIKNYQQNNKVDCILVDEAQFFTEDQIDMFFNIVVLLDIPVICYGLRTDFQMNGFKASSRLLLLAHSIEELKTICRCGSKAMFNGRKINGKFVFEGSQVAIDGEDMVTYESLCGKCFKKYRGY